MARFDGVVFFLDLALAICLKNFSNQRSLKELLVMHQFVVSYSL